MYHMLTHIILAVLNTDTIQRLRLVVQSTAFRILRSIGSRSILGVISLEVHGDFVYLRWIRQLLHLPRHRYTRTLLDAVCTLKRQGRPVNRGQVKCRTQQGQKIVSFSAPPYLHVICFLQLLFSLIQMSFSKRLNTPLFVFHGQHQNRRNIVFPASICHHIFILPMLNSPFPVRTT